MGKSAMTGQALVEYLLLMVIVAGAIGILFGMMPRVLNKLENPLRHDLKYAYKYGDPKACGYDDKDAPCSGTPVRHPAMRVQTDDNYRLFGPGPQ